MAGAIYIVHNVMTKKLDILLMQKFLCKGPGQTGLFKF
jgi:hypothetical protein